MGLHTTQFCYTALVKELHRTFLARLIFSYGDQDEGCGDDDHASSNSNNNSTKIFIDGCPMSIQSQFTLKTCLKVFMQWRVSTQMSEIHLVTSLLLPLSIWNPRVSWEKVYGGNMVGQVYPGSYRSSPLSKFYFKLQHKMALLNKTLTKRWLSTDLKDSLYTPRPLWKAKEAKLIHFLTLNLREKHLNKSDAYNRLIQYKVFHCRYCAAL